MQDSIEGSSAAETGTSLVVQREKTNLVAIEHTLQAILPEGKRARNSLITLIGHLEISPGEATAIKQICRSVTGRLRKALTVFEKHNGDLDKVRMHFAIADYNLKSGNTMGVTAKKYMDLAEAFQDIYCDPSDADDVEETLSRIVAAHELSEYNGNIGSFINKMLEVRAAYRDEIQSLDEAVSFYMDTKSRWAAEPERYGFAKDED